jgi:Universal stress protein family
MVNVKVKDLILSAREEETMEPFQPKLILCPTDFSKPATLALRHGKKMAGSFDARLVVLYANPFTPPPHFSSGQVDLVRSVKGRSIYC